MMYFFKGLGILGLLAISYGVWVKDEISQDVIFVFGGICLLLYSTFLQDPIFIALQIVFILSSLYEIYKLKKHV